MVKSNSFDENSMNKFIMLNTEGFNNDMVFYNEIENSLEK